MKYDIQRICKRCIAAGYADKVDRPLLYNTKTCPFGVDNIVTLYLFSNQTIGNLSLSPCDIEVDTVDELVFDFTTYGTRNTGNKYTINFSVNADFVVGIGTSPRQ